MAKVGDIPQEQLLQLDNLNQLAIRNLSLYDSYSDELPQIDNLGATGFGLEDVYLFSADEFGFTNLSEGKREAGINRLNQRLQAHADTVAALEAKQEDGETLSEREEQQLDSSKEVLEYATAFSDVLDIELSDQESNDELATTRAVLEEGKKNALETSDPAAALADNIGSTALALGAGPQLDTDAEKAAAIRDTIQCWLSYNSPAFARHRMTNMPVDAKGNISIPGYSSTSLVGAEDADKQRIALVNPETLGYGLQNKLGYRNGTKEFTSILTHEYAQISPTLRIYKVYRDYEGDLGVQHTVEFEFNNNTRLDGIARELVSNKPNGKTYSTYTRGSEIGVKSFDWQFIGTDPFTATRDISATLKLHAQSLAVLFKERKGSAIIDLGDSSELRTYKYIDLLVQPDCKQEYSPECFEVRVDVGYAPLEGPTAGVRENLKSSIRAQKDILYLVLVDHSFDIAEDGSVDVTINFKGRLETLMKTRKANVLLPYGGALQEALALDVPEENERLTPVQIEDRITEIKDKKSVSEADKERIKNLESALSDLSFKYKQIIHAHILDTMFKQDLIYTYDLNSSQKDVQNFRLFKKYQSKLSENQSLPPMIDDSQVSAQLGVSTSRPDPGDPVLSSDDVEEVVDAADTDLANLSLQSQRKVEFFYFGDLIATVLQSVTGENTAVGSITTQPKYWGLSSTKPRLTSKTAASAMVQQLFSKFRVIFGNVEVDSGFNPSIDVANNRINLAHMPISLEAYSAFYRNKILSSNTAEYPFFDFVDDVLTELVLDPLSSRCFNGLFDVSFRPKTTTMVVPNTINKDYYSQAAAVVSLSDQTVFTLPYNAFNLSKVPQNTQIFGFDMDSEAISSLNEYLVVGAEVQDLDILKGCESDDLKIGIVHLHFGNAQGMMKKVSFQKSDIEYLPELRYASEGNFLYNQLANVYDCSIDLIGNNLFKPGMYVYINTSALGAGDTFERTETTLDRSWANLMGLGGYHLVTEVAHSISRDGFNTTLKARWVASGQRAPGEKCPDLA